MDHNWMAQLPSSQQSLPQGQEMVFNPMVRELTPAPLQDGFQDNVACNFLKPLFANMPSASESTESTGLSSQSPASYDSPTVCILHTVKKQLTLPKAWSSVDSFPSIASNGPMFEQFRGLNSQITRIKQENFELVKHNQFLSGKVEMLLCVSSTTQLHLLTY